MRTRSPASQFNEPTIHQITRVFPVALLGHLVRLQRRRWLYEDFEDDAALAKLKIATLYVPDNVLVKFDKFSGDESQRHDPKELLADYPYPHRLVSAPELEQILASAKGPTYVFDYVKGSTDKFVTIFERQSGMVYRHYSSVSYNLDSDDFDVF
jgi:hypothetical protein